MPGPNAFTVNGNVGLMSQQNMLASGGNLFSVNCQTIGTAIAYAALTAVSATANGLFVIANAGAKTIYLQRLELFQTATVATGTTWSFEAYNETGIVAGTTAVITRTPTNINGSNAGTAAIVQAFNAGAITIPATATGATRKLQGQWWLPIGVNVIKDVYAVDFGADVATSGKNGGAAARATDTARIVTSAPPVVIAPNTTSWINLWGCGSAAPSFEYQLTYAEV